MVSYRIGDHIINIEDGSNDEALYGIGARGVRRNRRSGISKNGITYGSLFIPRKSVAAPSQIKYCPKCRPLLQPAIYMKEIDSMVCLTCSWIHRISNNPKPTNEQEEMDGSTSTTTGLESIDKLHDSQVVRDTSNRRFYNSGDPRKNSRFAKTGTGELEPDDESVRWAQNNNARIVEYREYIPKMGERSVSSEELRAQKR
jgi:RNase P subunit RPR2